MKIKSADDFRRLSRNYLTSPDDELWDLMVRICKDRREKSGVFWFSQIADMSNDELAPYIARYILEGGEE